MIAPGNGILLEARFPSEILPRHRESETAGLEPLSDHRQAREKKYEREGHPAEVIYLKPLLLNVRLDRILGYGS